MRKRGKQVRDGKQSEVRRKEKRGKNKRKERKREREREKGKYRGTLRKKN